MAKEGKKLRKQKRIAKQRTKTIQEVQRKPKYRIEFRKAFAVVATIILVFDVIITCIFGYNYIEFGEKVLNQLVLRNEEQIHEIEKKNGMYDFSGFESRELMFSAGGILAAEGMDVYQLLNEIDYAMDLSYPETYDFSFFGKKIYDAQSALKNRLHGVYTQSDYAYTMLYSTNGQLVSKEKSGFFLVAIDHTKKIGDPNRSKMYQLDMDNIRKNCPEAMDVLFSKEMIDIKANCGLAVEDVSINGCYFLPKTVKVHSFNVTEEENVLKEADLSNCDFTGYDKLFVDEEHKMMGPIFMGNISDIKEEYASYHQKYFNSLGEEVIKREVMNINNPDSEYEDYPYEYGFFSVKGFMVMRCGNVVDREGLVVVTVVDYNFFRDWCWIIIIYYSVTFLIAAAISTVLAKERYRKKEVLYEMDAYRRRTTNAMAHDLKSPLMIISGNAENMRQVDKEETYQQYTDGILNAVQDMDQMIANILDLAKLEDISLVLNKRDVGLAELIREEIEKKQEMLDEKNISVEVNGDVTIQCDRSQMTHLLDNLINNAIRYGKSDSVIEITLSDDHLQVMNHFEGKINVELQELLEPFVKGSQVRTKATGNGLGLSIVNQIAMAHGYILKLEVQEDMFTVEIQF